jgi:hypothetical protein
MRDILKNEILPFPFCFFFGIFIFTIHHNHQTIRVAIQQSTIILAGFLSEQLEGDLKRGNLVQEGKITQRQADEQAEQWEKVRDHTIYG